MPRSDPNINASDQPAVESAPVEATRSVDGRWIVLGVIILAVVLAVVGLEFRQPSPNQKKPATQPATTPEPVTSQLIHRH